MKGLTTQQRACLDAIRRLTVDGVPPSLGELTRELGLSSKGNVFRLLTALKDRGRIDWIHGRARSLVILEDQVSPALLHKLSSETLRTTAAHIAGILSQREGGGREGHGPGLPTHSRPAGISAAGGGVG